MNSMGNRTMVTADDIEKAHTLVKEKPSTSFLQRKMLISYTDAMVLMGIFEEEGLVSKPNSAGLRKLLR